MGYTWDIHGIYMGYDMNRMGEWVNGGSDSERLGYKLSPLFMNGQSVGAANRVGPNHGRVS